VSGYKGQNHDKPASPQPVSLNEARKEMRRLMRIFLQTSASYRAREEFVAQQHRAGRQNYSGDLSTVMGKDLLLGELGGTSKTLAILIQGCSAYILAEVAIKGRVPAEHHVCICGGEQAPWAGHSAPCRNQTGEHV
jgi:hypothetical protein